MTVSFIIATVGRPTLQRCLSSIETRPGDEIILVGEREFIPGYTYLYHPKGHDWGHSERNFAMSRARGSFLSFMDDDDLYTPGHRDAFESAMKNDPDRPTIFCMRLNHMGGLVLWQTQHIACGNVGTPMFFVPNDPTKLGFWPPYYGGDCTFMQSCKWESVAWSRTVIADVMGNNLPTASRVVDTGADVPGGGAV